MVEATMGAPALRALLDAPPEPGSLVRMEGATGSLPSTVVAALHQGLPGRILVVVAEGPDPARRVEADLCSLLGEDAVRLFPQGESLPYGEDEDPRISGLRVEAIEALLSGSARVFVTTPRGLQERIELPDRLGRLRLDLAAGEEIGFGLLVEELETLGY
ncbi:MAG: hypothetical protein EA352_10440, partial [Gemmatimonadales bacterium]